MEIKVNKNPKMVVQVGTLILAMPEENVMILRGIRDINVEDTMRLRSGDDKESILTLVTRVLYMRYYDVPMWAFKTHHDPKRKRYGNCLNELRKEHGTFFEGEIVTMIMFHKIADEVDAVDPEDLETRVVKRINEAKDTIDDIVKDLTKTVRDLAIKNGPDIPTVKHGKPTKGGSA